MFPLLALFLGIDVIMSQTIYKAYAAGILYEGWIWTYLGFAAMVLTGVSSSSKKLRITNVVAASVIAAVVFWLLADFGTWTTSHNIDMTTGLPFTKDAQGLVKCYIQGLPLVKNTILSNLVFSAIFWFVRLMQNKIPALVYSQIILQKGWLHSRPFIKNINMVACSFLPAATQMILRYGPATPVALCSFECPPIALAERQRVVRYVLEAKYLQQ